MSRWAEILLALTYPGLYAAAIFGPSIHGEHARWFFVSIFVWNTAILMTALLFVLSLMERFTKWRKGQQ
jgi:hypothetical protein